MGPNDKWSNLGPLIDVTNKKLMQFGIVSHYLSIDEQMVPYFGRHFLKLSYAVNQFDLSTRIGCFVDMS